MATTGIVLAKNFMVFQGGVAYGCQTDAEINISREAILLACKDGNSKKMGDITIEGTASGLFAYDHALGGMDAAKKLVEDDVQPVVIRYTTEDAADGYMEFNAFLTNVTVSGGIDGATTYSIQFTDADGTLYFDDAPQTP